MVFNRIVNELIRLKRKDSSGQVRWEATKVCRILHNATYKGYQGYYKSYKNNHLEQKTVINRDEDTYLYVKGNFTPIIPEEVWDKCKEIRESKIRLRKTQEGKFEKSGLGKALALPLRIPYAKGRLASNETRLNVRL